VSGIARWLASLGLDKYAGTFADAEIDVDILRELTETDLEKLGIPLGPRRKLLKAISGLHEGGADRPSETRASGPVGARAEAERRHITALFADMVGSTALAQGMDPEDLRDVIRGFQDAAAGAVVRFDGYVAKFMGDGLLAYFGWPHAHEDDAERAVRAGLALIEAARLLKLPQKVRIGIATGLVVVGDVVGSGSAREEAAIGETLNLAARLQAEAQPGCMVVDPATRGLLGGLFELEALGPRQLKGIAAPVEPWRVIGEAQADSRFEAARAKRLNPLVGREQEVALTLARWEQAKSGEGQAVLLRAEAGVGKSRIVEELRQRVGPVAASLRYQCSPHHVSSALHPVIQQITRAASINLGDTTEVKFNKLVDLAGQSDIRSSDAVALLAALLSIPPTSSYPGPSIAPQRQKAATLDLLVDLLSGLTKSGPVLIIVEDLHWSDPTTRELLDLIMGRMECLPVLMLVTFRPEMVTPWEGRGHATLVTLNRLSRRQVEVLAGQVAQGKLPDEVIEQICAKADGVPLFVEELTKAVLESGLLTASGDQYELAGALPPLAVPSSLQASLASRLGRLAESREVAQIGAALGREFGFDLLLAVAPLEQEQLADALEELHRAELVFPRGTPPRTTWVFKHALIQDAAYETMLKSARSQLHARIAQTMEASFPASVEHEPEVYARHLTEAGYWTDAIQAWRSAAHRTARRSAPNEAIALFRRAIELVPRLQDAAERDAIELDLQIGFGSALMAVQGFGADVVGIAFARAHELSARVADPVKRFQILNGLWKFHLTRGELDHAMQIALEGKQVADLVPDDDGIALEADNALGVSYFQTGSVTTAIRHLEAAFNAYDFDRHSRHIVQYARDPGVNCSAYLSWAYALAGFPDRARQQIAWTVDLDKRLNHALTAWITCFGAAGASQALRDMRSTGHFAELMHANGLKHHISIGVGMGLVLLNWARLWDDPTNFSIDEMTRGIAESRPSGVKSSVPYLEYMKAEALLELGHWSEAASLLDELLLRVEKNGPTTTSELLRLRGVLHQHDGSTDLAESYFHRSFKIAEGQGARLFQLRTATDLARLYLDQGEPARARAVLEPLYSSFDEGFDTADLLAAQGVLDRCMIA
jgi:class 3 adenylate cyclase/tetratricopeptide (TPR) repeat protein